jgi:TusA-related sulfurtransferase
VRAASLRAGISFALTQGRSKHARAYGPGIRLVTMHTFDLRRTLVPFSLLEIRQRFKEMQPGDSMVVLWSDTGAADDLLRILPDASFDIVSRAGIPGDPGGLRMELTKR